MIDEVHSYGDTMKVLGTHGFIHGSKVPGQDGPNPTDEVRHVSAAAVSDFLLLRSSGRKSFGITIRKFRIVQKSVLKTLRRNLLLYGSGRPFLLNVIRRKELSLAIKDSP